MTMPNFLIIGAQKSATTTIAYYLEQHPEIFMSPIKEPGFFDFEGTAPSFSGPGDREMYELVVSDINGYQNLFREAQTEKAIGEATTWYLYSEEAPKRIKSYIPNVKLIVVLRNPISRAYSAYMHTVRDGREKLSFHEALNAEEARIRANWEYIWRYQEIGFYSKQLKRYLCEFSRDQIKVFLYEDFCDRTDLFFRDLFKYLGVNQEFNISISKNLNISGVTKSKLVHSLLKDTNPFKKTLKPFLPTSVREFIANKARALNYHKQPCAYEDKVKLLEIFRSDILELQEIIGRDLSHWLKLEG